jgi:hypothetical protein
MGRFITAPDAAVESNRHPVTVRKALEAGELHGFQRVARGRWSIRSECLDAWVENRPCEHKSNVTPINQHRAKSA